ncbi:MAG: phosphotransferase family protein [Chloroflexota bacterium]
MTNVVHGAANSELHEKLREALAVYWSSDEPGHQLKPDLLTDVHAVRGWEALRATVPAYGRRQAAFVKVFADSVSFEREQDGLTRARAVAIGADEGARVPAELCAVVSAQALIMEHVEGVPLSRSLRKTAPFAPRVYADVFYALGKWLARFHAQKPPQSEPAALLARQELFIRDVLERAEPRIGAARLRAARRLLDRLLTSVATDPGRAVYCHGDFQPDNMILSRNRVNVVDFAYSGVGYPEQDLVLLRHNLIMNTTDLPFAFRLVRPLWSAFVAGYGHPSLTVGTSPTWDLFELRYQSFSVSSEWYRDAQTPPRRLLLMYRYFRTVGRFRRWLDDRSTTYGL